ncbi:MAG TPA: polysaccharide pyruvyl transferase family protein [Thermomicrobiaceae bacterium]|nr:polysaccharide pyruvyl transferase family protein [Thermomicrobiaceae bacterium]
MAAAPAVKHDTSPPSVMMMGYNGANNTGAEALLLADIEDVRAVLGPEALITVPTLNPVNLRRYLREGPYLRIAPFPSIYFRALRRLVRQHDLIMLVEGSSYMDTWTSALLWAYLWVTRCADGADRPCLAYAVDAGTLNAVDRVLVRRYASKTGLIVVRAEEAAERLRAWGVTAPIESTADNAFTFHPDAADEGLLRRLWPEASGEIAGVCPVNFYLWPVVMRPWGRREDCYRWPYYFSHSAERTCSTEALVVQYAALADCLVAQQGMSVALICMEQLDEPLALQVREHMARADAARVFSAREYNASQMTSLLRGLDLLLTSRYHAAVLSLAAQVPQIAVGHDLRLKTLYEELGLAEGFFVDPHDADLCATVLERVEHVLEDPRPIKEALSRGYDDHLQRARHNRDLLRAFVADHGWEVVG